MISDAIKEISEKLRNPDNLHGSEATEYLVQLSSLLASQNVIVTQKLWALNQTKKTLLAEYHTAAKAKIMAEASFEWKEWKDAEVWAKAAEDLIKSLKYHIRRLESENINAKY